MVSREYWRLREQLHIAEMKAKEAEYDRDITSIYDEALAGINKEIEAFYQRYATAEGLDLQTAKMAVKQADIKAYEKLAERLVRDQDRSPEYDSAMRIYNATMKINRLELLKSKIGMYCAIAGGDLEKYMTETLSDEGREEAERQAGILGDTLKLNDPEEIKKIVRGSWRVSMEEGTPQSTFSERIWGQNRKLKENLGNLLTSAIIGGKGPVEIARDLRKQFDATRYEAERLMRTESARVQTAIQLGSLEDAGYEQYEYIAEPTACGECAALDSRNAKRYYRLDESVVGVNMPPMHPNCRCSICAAWGEYEEETETPAEDARPKRQATKVETIKAQLKTVNPKYDTGRLYQNNCGYCTFTTEMVRRGMNVEANPLDGMYVSKWRTAYKGFNPIGLTAKRKDAAKKELYATIKGYGEGSRVTIFGLWSGRKWGHYFNAEVVDGEVVIYDGQNGRYDADYIDRMKPSSIRFGRVDNLEPSDGWIGKACTVKGEQ